MRRCLQQQYDDWYRVHPVSLARHVQYVVISLTILPTLTIGECFCKLPKLILPTLCRSPANCQPERKRQQLWMADAQHKTITRLARDTEIRAECRHGRYRLPARPVILLCAVQCPLW